MDVAADLRRARVAAGLSQRALAARARTSQAAVAAYETGRKDPTTSTLVRLLAATGARLQVVPARSGRAPLPDVGRALVEVIRLAAVLPVHHADVLCFPRLPRHDQQ